jgi:hypothetical protein
LEPVAGGQLAGGGTGPGEPCPKCGYIRAASDANPAWQCPKCLVAYAKVRGGTASRAARLVASRQELAAEARSDSSVYALLAVNLLSGAFALYFSLSPRDLAIVYWLQSIFIGLSFFIRILCLRGYTVNRGPEDFTRDPGEPGGNVPAAFTFLGLYVMLHLFYLVFLLGGSQPMEGSARIIVAGSALAFGANHLYSLLHNLPADRAASPNLDAMLFIPLIRIMPMHMVASCGVAAGEQGERTLFLVILIAAKTGADVLMHVIEHHELRRNPLDS